ncbi:MAG: response regulator [Elusimicrobia bacterium]|nr:response regulator [Elusimicrobiota bacterium]
MKKIMIVEDDDVTIRLLRFMLEKKDYKVVVCYNGKEAVEAVGKEKPDLILMDIMMPQMNGIEATETISGDPKTSKIPIIILSALGQEGDVMRGLEAGAVSYVVKPFDSQALLRQIDDRLA